MMKYTRRGFIKHTSIATAAVFPTIVPSLVFGDNAPSKRVTLGFIGMGSQGVNANLRNFLGQDDAQVVAVCDAYMGRARNACKMVNDTYGNEDCKAVQDFREIIADPTIDAVVISTPDHWHVPISLMALKAGKDVFSEKPTLSIKEGRVLADAFAKRDAIFQAGIEDRSSIHFHKMVEWIKNGAIGKLEQVKIQMPAGVSHPKESAIEPPADLDWNLWQGPAQFHEYTKNRTHPWHWRNTNMYSKGAILDMGTHLVDTAQIAINDPSVCPVEVSGEGEIPVGQESDVPVKYNLKYRYSNGVEMTVKNSSKGYWDAEGCHFEFIGDKGWIRRIGWSAPLEASDPKILKIRYTPEETKHWPFPPGEQRNFLDCVKSRKPTTYPALDLHQMSTTLHMGVICIQLGRKLRWDTKKEVFIKDAEANRLCKRPKARDWEAKA